MSKTTESISPKDALEDVGKPTLVLGASLNPRRTSFTAIHHLREAGHKVYALGGRNGTVADIEILKARTDEPLPALPMPDLHTITLYLNARRQESYYDYILSLSPQRIIFNPGAENRQLFDLATAKGIQCLEACTLVMLNFGRF
ncbi:MAG TPA: CoA-binding protein [Bacteroidetes bacterium]|nr:CoA-binding protein [Bacteroidota bacterium]